ncbi:MAG: DUF2058 domain-containing protein [Gammaproteobacteria bacterium]|nr:DUF2058 domain-containing protein [Gammaproteobacteria bacterium]
MASLADQLLNMGVVDKKKAKKSQHQKRKTANKNRKAVKSGKEVQADVMKQQLEQAARDKQERDLELNKKRDTEQAQKALVAEVGQIVDRHSIEISKDAELAYNFSHNSKVKKLYISEEQQKELTQGYLAIAVTGDSYALIPDKIAERIESRLPELVIRTQVEQTTDENDPYADYQIPDDLMW